MRNHRRRVPAIFGNGAGGSSSEMPWLRSCRIASDSLEHANTRASLIQCSSPATKGFPWRGVSPRGTPAKRVRHATAFGSVDG